MSRAGKVWLVGAGPGDPELVTLKAVRVLARADVILHDDLVHPALLEHARPGARVVPVGKRGGCKSTPQPFIERLMIAEARSGCEVARLKGGDPLVFGRGGEEVDALRAAGLEVEVVSGVSAGLAAAASLCTSLTDRRVSHGVTFVTGHAHAPNHGVDWTQLARSRMTLVIYMGVGECRSIADALLGGGLPSVRPAAVVEKASLPEERRLHTTLGRLADDVASSGMASPSIMIVGEVLAGAELGKALQYTAASA
jgi:uroporphyrin-III C-methyltransferase